MANLGDFGKFRLIVWRDENPSTVNEISVAVSQTDRNTETVSLPQAL